MYNLLTFFQIPARFSEVFMSRSSPAVAPDQNVTIKTTTYKEVVPAAKKEYPEFFEFVRAIPAEKTNDYMIYLYRVDPSKVPIDHTPGKMFDVPGIGPVSVLDQEALESAVGQACGGGTYRLICNLRSSGEWQCQTMFRIDLPIRQNLVAWYSLRGENKIDTNGKPIAYASSGGGSDGHIANRLVDVVASQEHKAVDLALTTMERAGNMIRNYSPQPPLPPVPAPDPFEQEFKKKMIEHMFRQMENGGTSTTTNGGGISQNLAGLREVIAFARELSGAAAPAASVGAEMVRVVASAIPQAIEGIREWRLGQEAARDAAAIMHAQAQPRAAAMPPQMLPPAHNFPSVNPTKIPPPQPVSHPAPQSAQPGPTSEANGNDGAPTIEFVEHKIVEIFRDPRLSAETAAEETIGFLENLAGPNPPPQRDYVNQLAQLGEPGLVQLFQMKPNLQPACVNTGRLLEFIRAFLRIHAQDMAEDEAQHKPN
jgi:hypothetical protein